MARASNNCISQLFQMVHREEPWSVIEGSLRDTLLPRLISGDLRVENTERFIGRTAV